MGTREVYEQKLRSGNLHHDPTINPGLGSPRCPRCLSLINPNSKSGEWTITSVLHDATAVAGAGIGGMLSAVYGINTGIPYIQNRVRGPKWLPFIIGMPPLLMFSATCAAFGGVPHFTKACALGVPCASGSGRTLRLESQFVNDSNFSRAVFIGYALPKFAQLTVTSYYAASSASHYGISLLTRHIEEVHTAQSHREKLR
ncbi:hypothetical protein CK203_035145 [Vitis vinifera]|uniref:Uncharacterized protein n=1 Tax=Vitis vinifera TaxID=29760 RepID=A0A438C4D7_VITVI|nr:hypothetical protein CK203_116962 [Vitis vinifera]RVW81437.1 hypothetical protein CK203_035145 [Vitis vinifera]